ncbi:MULTISPECIES: glycosyltransferase family A protein [unclassified Microbacterium]|uniref:glycosyltransferase n=1 Tax=unclassified Microbacterium TaxID=2609290 RepID=UPI00214BAFF7|nr:MULTISPECIES: glycosyltransferase family A protein [unclassified Microbacterium]MCR2809340.1 glycosyltransferase family 2 protein [Microbacterium sp. zg.B185]WIM20480.1 glycosyltransferase family A protein [Microbacterium sp. zg-B185]
MPSGSSGRLTVSVVVPVKDDATELARCLRALALQTRTAHEIVVVDNGSRDHSAQVGRDAGARVVRCDRPGIPAASAYGYDQASGDIILRLDADCLPGPRWIETMAVAFEARPEVAAFTGGARFIDGPRPLRRWLAAAYLGAYAAVLIPTLGHLPLFGSNLAFRRDVWRGIRSHVHRISPSLHDDLDLAFHLGERHRIRYLPDAAMGISMRPFADRRAFAQRVARGFGTVLVHWPQDFPPVRWVRLGLRRGLRQLGVPAPGRSAR